MRPFRAELWRFLVPLTLVAALTCGAASGLLGTCGPFTDTANDAFCPFILEVFYLGISTGTTPTTYDPTSNVNRTQMATFLSRTVDGVLKRGSRRAALKQFWKTRTGFTPVWVSGSPTYFIESDGSDVFIASYGDGSIIRRRTTDGADRGVWTGATNIVGIMPVGYDVFATGETSPGRLYMIDNAEQEGGAVKTVATDLGNNPLQLAFDGDGIWTANYGPPGSVSRWNGNTTTVTAGFSAPYGILFDGSHIWVTDYGAGKLFKLDSAAAILQTVTVGTAPAYPVFDGTNIWVPNTASNSLSVVRAATGAVLATLTGNGLSGPTTAAFDGERVLVTNLTGQSVSLWKAADLTKIATVHPPLLAGPYGACSDGIDFWVSSVDGSFQRF